LIFDHNHGFEPVENLAKMGQWGGLLSNTQRKFQKWW